MAGAACPPRRSGCSRRGRSLSPGGDRETRTRDGATTLGARRCSLGRSPARASAHRCRGRFPSRTAACGSCQRHCPRGYVPMSRRQRRRRATAGHDSRRDRRRPRRGRLRLHRDRCRSFASVRHLSGCLRPHRARNRRGCRRSCPSQHRPGWRRPGQHRLGQRRGRSQHRPGQRRGRSQHRPGRHCPGQRRPGQRRGRSQRHGPTRPSGGPAHRLGQRRPGQHRLGQRRPGQHRPGQRRLGQRCGRSQRCGPTRPSGRQTGGPARRRCYRPDVRARSQLRHAAASCRLRPLSPTS
jgi:ferredoxin